MSEYIRCNACGEIFQGKPNRCPVCSATDSFSIRTASDFHEARKIFAEEEERLIKEVRGE